MMPESRFRYWRDPVCLGAVAIYLLNRFVVKPATGDPGDFWHCYANDVLCLPVWLPVALWLQRLLRVRTHDLPPTLGEIALHWLLWSLFFEGLGPSLQGVFPNAVADPWDVVAYAAGGGIAAWLWKSPRDPFRRGDWWRRCFEHVGAVLLILTTMLVLGLIMSWQDPLDPRQLRDLKGFGGESDFHRDIAFSCHVMLDLGAVVAAIWLLQRLLASPPFRRLDGTDVARLLLQLVIALVLAWEILASDRSSIGVH
jgi:hypothetical protein